MACKLVSNFTTCFLLHFSPFCLLQPVNRPWRCCTLPKLSLVRGLSMNQTPTSCYGWTSIHTLSTFSTWIPSRTGESLQYLSEKQRFYAICNISVFLREIKLPGTVGAVVPVEGSKDVIALVGRKVCRVNRETG